MKDGQVLEILGLAPGPDQLHRPHPITVVRPRVLNQLHHILQNLLRRHRRAHLLAIGGARLHQIEGQALGRRIRTGGDQLLLDRPNNLSAVVLPAADHGADAKVEAPIGLRR